MAFRWAVIGGGKDAIRAFNEISRTGRHKAVTVFSLDSAEAANFSARFGAKQCSSLLEAVRGKDIQGVYICSGTDSHYALALQVVRMGKAVLVEAPITVNYAQLKELLTLAKENDIYVAEAMWVRFCPVVRRVRDLILRNSLGRIVSIRSYMGFTSKSISRAELRAEKGGGALFDVGVYQVSMTEMLMGYPTSIKSTANFSRRDTDSSTKSTFYFDSSETVLSSTTKRLPRGIFKAHGEYGDVCIRHFMKPTKAVLHINGYRQVIKGECGYIYMFDKVAQDITEGKIMSEEVSWASSMNVLRTLDGCRIKTGLRYPRNIETTRVVLTEINTRH